MDEMALPHECVGPVCDAFLQRTENLLSAPECNIPNIHYGVLTLKSLAEKNEHALLYITSVVVEQQNHFLKTAFKFMLSDVPNQEGRPEAVEMLYEFITSIISCSSSQKIMFANEVAVKEILTSLQLLLVGEMLKKIQFPILHLVVTALYQFSSRWPSQPKGTQRKAVDVLRELLQQIPMQPATQVLVKAILIQLLALVQQPLNDAVVINMEEADFLLSATASAPNVEELLLLLKYLTVCVQNRLILMERGILDSLATLVDENDGQNDAAQLICELMDAASICSEDQMNAQALERVDEANLSTPSSPACDGTQLQVSDDGSYSNEVCNKEEKSPADNGATNLIKVLLPCTLSCFETFISACYDRSVSVASLQVMYTSTLLRLMLDVYSQEDEHTQTAVADSLATFPGVPDAFLTMLRGSTVMQCSMEFSLLPLPFISTFINIQNCLITWTNCSEQFCQALCNAGLVPFMETDLDRLITTMPSIDGSESTLGVPSRPVLAIIYNCVQKQKCLPSFLRAISLNTSLEMFTTSPDLETRFLSKLIMGFLLLTLTTQQQSLLQLKPDEEAYLVSTLSGASQSPDLSADGYSASELLQGLLNFLEVKENLPIGVDPVLLKIFPFFLKSSDQNLQRLVLHIVWNILTATNAHIKDSLVDIISMIRTLRVTPELEVLHHCVLILTKQPGELGCEPVDLLTYARGCYQYQKYRECSAVAEQIVKRVIEDKLEQSMANEANLLNGKSLYFAYQNEQHMFLKTRSSQPIKQVESLKNECYEKAKRAIFLLGVAHDLGFLDEEGSRYLDFAMIDYLRETNNLSNCQRCLLCRKRSKVRRSHIYPRSILKKIARDLMEGHDHKVFTHVPGKVVTRSAGGLSFGMLCTQCEQCLSQNGEEQFAKHIHSRICINRKVVQSQLKLQYGSWLYDFCIGIIFRSMAICDQFVRFGTDDHTLYKLFTDCRKHLLSLPTKSQGGDKTPKPKTTASPYSPPGSPLPIFFLVNPTLDVPPDESKLGYLSDALITPGTSFILVDLHNGEVLHDQSPSILVHFDRMNILVPLQPFSTPSSLPYKIEPCGGELVVPEEYERWQVIPTGIWKIFFSLVEASQNFDRSKRSHKSTRDQLQSSASPSEEAGGTTLTSATTTNFVYSSEGNFHQKNSTIVSLLPDCYTLVPNEDTREVTVTVQFPSDHEVIMYGCREWGHEQSLTYFVAEDCSRLYLIFVLSLPGLHVVDGLFLDVYNRTVTLPFLDKRGTQYHPLKPSVLQALLKQNPEIEEYLHIRPQLS